MTEENTPVEDVNTPVEQRKTLADNVKEQADKAKENEVPMEMLPSVVEENLRKAYQRGANLLYAELIGYLFKTIEVFAANFVPEGGDFENFLGFTLHTMGEEYNKKYIEPKKAKDEKKDDGKPKEGQYEAKDSQEAP